MKNINKIVVTFLLSTTLLSCASLPKYESKMISDNTQDDTYRFYDNESKIRYDVYNDTDNIYVRIATSDYLAQAKILKLGFNIWVDQKGKKNKDVGIIFPQKQDIKKDFDKKNKNSLGQGEVSNQERQNKQLENLHEQYENSEKLMSIINLGDVTGIEDINLEFEQYDVTASIDFDEYGELQYEAIIPIKYIFTDKKYDDGVYSVGIVSGKIDMANSMRSQQGSSGKGGGKGGGKGKGKGMGGGKSGGVRNQMSGLSTPIDIWFSVDIKK